MDNAGRIIYLNPVAGISGDMFLGALSDAAKALDADFSLENLLKIINLENYSVSAKQEERGGIRGVKVNVAALEKHPHRRLSDVCGILETSGLPERAKNRAIEAFILLAEAEAKVHGVTPEEIHFHEVGAVDAIIDVAGAMLLMDLLGWPSVVSSPVNVGSGTVRCAHGVLPVPAPATTELLKGMKIFSSGEPIERTTPTGALLLRVLAGPAGFRDLPPGRLICAGTGLGSKDTSDTPNALCVALIETAPSGDGRFRRDEPSLIEANIDDMNPQDFAPASAKLFAAGALDVWSENILMKKSRPAIKLCCLCQAEDSERLGEIMIRETTTLGVRITKTRRIFLDRSLEEAKTSLGSVRVKSAFLDGQTIRKIPEYDDLHRISGDKNLPMPAVRKIIEREI
jgi:uncharacterized protein (TIGR00299 family) protein